MQLFNSSTTYVNLIYYTFSDKTWKNTVHYYIQIYKKKKHRTPYCNKVRIGDHEDMDDEQKTGKYR